MGYFHFFPEGLISVLIAFLGGGIILNAIKEELPDDRESDFLFFLTGVSGYSVLLLSL